jgi:hypothetical protein
VKKKSFEWLSNYEKKQKQSVDGVRSNIYSLLGVATFRESPTRPEVSKTFSIY